MTLETLIDKCTDENKVEDDWGSIFEVIEAAQANPKGFLKPFMKRLFHKNPHTQMRSVSLLDAVIQNLGASIIVELNSRDFLKEIKQRYVMISQQPRLLFCKILIKLHNDHSGRPEFGTFANIFDWLNDTQKSDISMIKENDLIEEQKNKTRSQARQSKEQDDLAMAIAMSLNSTAAGKPNSSEPKKGILKKSGGAPPDDANSSEYANLYENLSSSLTLHDNNAIASCSSSSGAAASGGYVASSASLSPQLARQQLQTSGRHGGGGGGSGGGGGGQSNSASNAAPIELKKVRALYDFEAIEENELTLKSGEIIVDVDTNNEHWWHGSNHRGKGLFPAQFVTLDLNSDIEETKRRAAAAVPPDSTSNNKQTGSSVNDATSNSKSGGAAAATNNAATSDENDGEINESLIENCLTLLGNSDPEGLREDPPEMEDLERRVRQMGPEIDRQLVHTDKQHATLTDLNKRLLDALHQYNQLMLIGSAPPPNQSYMMQQPGGGMMMPPLQQQPQMQQPPIDESAAAQLHHQQQTQYPGMMMQQPAVAGGTADYSIGLHHQAAGSAVLQQPPQPLQSHPPTQFTQQMMPPHQLSAANSVAISSANHGAMMNAATPINAAGMYRNPQ